jgi:hypothetical protein
MKESKMLQITIDNYILKTFMYDYNIIYLHTVCNGVLTYKITNHGG